MTTKKEKVIFEEYGSKPTDKVYEVLRSHTLQTVKRGPTVILPIGSHTRQRYETAIENFVVRRITPIDRPESLECRAVDKFSYLQDGEYVDIFKDDILAVSWGEFVALFISNKVRPTEYKLFGGD